MLTFTFNPSNLTVSTYGPWHTMTCPCCNTSDVDVGHLRAESFACPECKETVRRENFDSTHCNFVSSYGFSYSCFIVTALDLGSIDESLNLQVTPFTKAEALDWIRVNRPRVQSECPDIIGDLAVKSGFEVDTDHAYDSTPVPTVNRCYLVASPRAGWTLVEVEGV